jgi:hypothetical protein
MMCSDAYDNIGIINLSSHRDWIAVSTATITRAQSCLLMADLVHSFHDSHMMDSLLASKLDLCHGHI